jgi:hypothetical protein
MAHKFSLKSLTDPDTAILVAPILVVASTFHIFDASDLTHKIGQMEILAAILVCCYYLWKKIEVVYPAALTGKKKIEAVVCVVIGIFTAMVLMPPLLSWQYFNLYRSSDRISLNKPILIAVVSLWVGIGILYTSSFLIAKAQVEAMANNPVSQESSIPEAVSQ